jgi:excisionase family DNA binding protein
MCTYERKSAHWKNGCILKLEIEQLSRRLKLSEKILYSRLEAAQLLSISLRTLDHLQQKKEITTRRIGRKVLIPARELEKFASRDHDGRKTPRNASVSAPTNEHGNE